MKFLFDLFPVILFFAVFKLAGSHTNDAAAFAQSIGYQTDPAHLPVLLATAAAILGTLAQVLWVKIKHGRVDTMLWISFFIILIFGGATLMLHDEAFIKFKPSALYWLFAAVLLAARLLFKRNLIRSMLQDKIMLPDTVWDKLNLAWSLFFASLGVLNLYVAYNYSTETWVNFKMFGATGLLFVFILLHGLVLAKYPQPDHKE